MNKEKLRKQLDDAQCRLQSLRAKRTESYKRIRELRSFNDELSTRLEQNKSANVSINARDARLLKCARSFIDILQGNTAERIDPST